MTADTRQRIVEAAIRALAREGYAATSVKDIAQAGGAPACGSTYLKTK